ncbi:MAG: hypothetical protein ACOY0T_18805 [Myxococcota bacterium]
MSDAKRLFREAAVAGCSALLFHACSVDRKGGQGGDGGSGSPSGPGSGGKPSIAGGALNAASGGKAASGASSVVARGGSTDSSGGEAVDAMAGSGAEAADGGTTSNGSGGAPAAGTSSTGGAIAVGTGGSISGGGPSGSGGTVHSACTTNPCKNGGTCSPGSGGSYTCTCSNRFVGASCEFQRFMGVPIAVSAMSQDGSLLAGQSCQEGGSCSAAKMSSAGGAVTLLKNPTALPAGVTLTTCVPSAINGNGSWIGGRCQANVGSGFGSVEWETSSATGAYITGRNANDAIAGIGGVSTDASIIAGTLVSFTSTTTSVGQIFRRTAGSGVVVLPPLNSGEFAGVNAVSNDGLLLVGSSGGHPFRWHPSSGMQALAELPNAAPNQDQSYVPHDISADGSVIVGAFATRGGPTALRWTSAGVTSLGLGEVVGTNHDGSLLVGSTTNGACAWDGAGSLKTMLDVIGSTPDAAGWTLSTSVAISDDGKVISGTGIKDGKYQSWIAHLP